MTMKPRDPLLASARLIINAGVAVLGLGIAALAVGLPALLLNQGRILAEMTKDGKTVVSPDFFLAASVTIVITAILLGIGIWFLVILRRIVGTVAAGDPFIVDNADRLSLMGWIALGWQIVSIPVGFAAHWLSGMVKDSDTVRIDDDFGFSAGGIVLVVVLFVLARVFREGTRMRDELEGTV